MKSMVLILVTLAACAAQSPPPSSLAPFPPPPIQTDISGVHAGPATSVATPAIVATNAYRGAEAKEGHAVTRPSATVRSINAIGEADRGAREALSQLVAQDGHPTPAAIAAAKQALDNLIAALEATSP